MADVSSPNVAGSTWRQAPIHRRRCCVQGQSDLARREDAYRRAGLRRWPVRR